MIFSSTSHLSLARSGLLVRPVVLSHLHNLVHRPPLRRAIRDHLQRSRHPVVSNASRDRCQIPLVRRRWGENTHIVKSWEPLFITITGDHQDGFTFFLFAFFGLDQIKLSKNWTTDPWVTSMTKSFLQLESKHPTSTPKMWRPKPIHPDILPPIQLTCFNPDSVTYTRPNESTATPVGRSNCSRVSPGPNPPATISPISTSSLQRLTMWAFESAI